MDDDKILARGGDEHDIEEYAKQTNKHDLTKANFKDIGSVLIVPESLKGVAQEITHPHQDDFTKLPPIVTTVYDHATVVVQDHVKKLTIIRGDTEVTIILKPKTVKSYE